MSMEKEPLTFEQAKEAALRLIEFRSHSEKELRTKLFQKGAKPDDIDEIVEFCTRYGFICDRQYAISKARDLFNLKKLGIRRIEQELAQRGIEREYIDEAIAELDCDAQTDTLMSLVEKRLRGDFEKKNCDRVIRYFIYRGYKLSDIKNCIERIKNENGI